MSGTEKIKTLRSKLNLLRRVFTIYIAVLRNIHCGVSSFLCKLVSPLAVPSAARIGGAIRRRRRRWAFANRRVG